MKFVIKADAQFQAEDIDDAFAKLGAHFKALAEQGLDGDDQLIERGTIDIRPVDEATI